MNLSTNEKNLLLLLGLHKDSSIQGYLKLIHMIYFIQSEIFSLNKNNHCAFDNFEYSFSRGNYGPYTTSINSNLTYLESLKLIDINTVSTIKSSCKKYKLTDKGIKVFNAILDEQNKYHLKLSAFNLWVEGFSKYSQEQVLSFTYKQAGVFNFEIGDQMPLFVDDSQSYKNKSRFGLSTQ